MTEQAGLKTIPLCFICNHPGREMIESFIWKNREVDRTGIGEKVSYLMIADIVQREYPESLPLKPHHFGNHVKKHMDLKQIVGYILKDGKLARPDGKVLDHINPRTATMSVVTLGIIGILGGQIKLRATDVLKAIELMIKIDGGADEVDDVKKAWLDALVRDAEEDEVVIRQRRGRRPAPVVDESYSITFDPTQDGA